MYPGAAFEEYRAPKGSTSGATGDLSCLSSWTRTSLRPLQQPPKLVLHPLDLGTQAVNFLSLVGTSPECLPPQCPCQRRTRAGQFELHLLHLEAEVPSDCAHLDFLSAGAFLRELVGEVRLPGNM
jgi:hypothetical protein